VPKPRGKIAPDIKTVNSTAQDDQPRDNNKTANTPVRHLEYRLSERVFLSRGDKIRVSAGPYYESRDPDGNVVRAKMAERGVMVFCGYCELGETRWIEACGKSGFAALRISDDDGSGSTLMPGFVRRPYKITKLRAHKARAKARVVKAS
jgi:hypothetical protein